MKVLLFLALGYGAIVLLMYGAQTSLIFPGARLPSRPLDHPFAPERLVIDRGGGVRLAGMLFTPEKGRPSAGLVIGFGGNAQDAEDLGQDLAGTFRRMHVAVFHYRGYGESTGEPGERALLDDALAIHDHLVEALSPRALHALGISLGSGVAGWLSKERSLDGVLLVTPYDSIEAVARQAYPWLPVGLLLKHRFRTLDAMAGNRTPVAIIAAENDRVIKPARTEALRQAIERLVFDRTIKGAGHAEIHGMAAYQEALLEALDALNAAAPETLPRSDKGRRD
ncbi:MAG: alpha/beta hydrolase [Geminicoccaceae bacterium]